MKKNILLFMTAIFATILLLSLGSATITVDPISDLSQESGNFEVVIQSTLNESVSLSIEDIFPAGNAKIEFTGYPVNNIELNDSNNRKETFNINYTIQSGFNFELGESYSTNLVINGSNSTTVTKIISFESSNYCFNEENKGELDISSIQFNTVSGFGDDDKYWYLRDVVEIEFDVDNRGDWDIEKMEVEWSIYVDGKEVMDGTESITDLDRNDDTTVTFEIKLDENIDEFENGDVTFYVKAFGDIDDKDSNFNGDETCDSAFEIVDVNTRDDFVIIDEFKINNQVLDGNLFEEKLACGSEVIVSAQVWNIGEDDQDDVYIEIYSSLLELYKKIEIGSIDAYDSFDLEYAFTLPEDLDLIKNYKIQYEVFDDGNDIFENDENDEAIFYNYFKVEGNCVTVAPTVGAELTTDAFSGKEMTVQATVRNNEPNSVIYTLSANGFSEWAESVTIEPQVISLESGESKTVNFNFKVLSSSEGDYTFDIETTEGDNIVLTQPAAVTIEKKAFNLGALTEKENLKLAGIIALNLIFIALIIIVARKILRRK